MIGTFKTSLLVSSIVIIGFLSGQSADAQTLGQGSKKPRPISSAPQNANSPVTKSEVSAIFKKVDQAVAKSIIQKNQPAAKPVSTSGIASRSEIITEFYRIYQLCKHKFRYTANPGMIEANLITIPKTDPSRKMIENLITWGFIGRYDPIATSKTQGMLPEDFGFAVAQFLGRLCELTHTPSSKFSPTMMREDG